MFRFTLRGKVAAMEHTSLDEIKNLMARSSRFLSLSGLGGIFSGVIALLGAAAAWYRTQQSEWIKRTATTDVGAAPIVDVDWSVALFLAADAALVLVLSIAAAYYFTAKRARRLGQPLWGPYSGHLLRHLLVPLLVGTAFCAVLFNYDLIGFIAPATLVFYGLALFSASKFTHGEVAYLGLTEMLLGIVALLFYGQGLLFWALGFGAAHIVYGFWMYARHER